MKVEGKIGIKMRSIAYFWHGIFLFTDALVWCEKVTWKNDFLPICNVISEFTCLRFNKVRKDRMLEAYSENGTSSYHARFSTRIMHYSAHRRAIGLHTQLTLPRIATRTTYHTSSLWGV